MSTDEQEVVIEPEEFLVVDKTTEKVPDNIEIDDITIGDEHHEIKSINEITMPLMRAVRLPPVKPAKWWQVWTKVVNGYHLSKPRTWVIEEEYLLWYPPLNIYLCIPKGFIFDGASVPRVLWPFMSPTGAMFLAGLFHDFGYRYNCYYDKDRNIIYYDESKSFFDEHFRRMGIFVNNANIRSGTAWFGLWVGGFMAWNDHRKNNLHPYDKFPKSIIKE